MNNTQNIRTISSSLEGFESGCSDGNYIYFVPKVRINGAPTYSGMFRFLSLFFFFFCHVYFVENRYILEI